MRKGLICPLLATDRLLCPLSRKRLACPIQGSIEVERGKSGGPGSSQTRLLLFSTSHYLIIKSIYHVQEGRRLRLAGRCLSPDMRSLTSSEWQPERETAQPFAPASHLRPPKLPFQCLCHLRTNPDRREEGEALLAECHECGVALSQFGPSLVTCNCDAERVDCSNLEEVRGITENALYRVSCCKFVASSRDSKKADYLGQSHLYASCIYLLP